MEHIRQFPHPVRAALGAAHLESPPAFFRAGSGFIIHEKVLRAPFRRAMAARPVVMEVLCPETGLSRQIQCFDRNHWIMI
jgi:hypothetical protein